MSAMEVLPHPNDYWIVSSYQYKPRATLAEAEAARDKLIAQFPDKRFRVIHCKHRLPASNSGEIINDLVAAVRDALTCWGATTTLYGENVEALRRALAKAESHS